MKLLDSHRPPNPRRVPTFLAEKALEIERGEVDIEKRERRSLVCLKIIPSQRTPALVADDRTVLTQSIAICRYIEECHPNPALFGRSPLHRAQIEIWQRRLERHLLLLVALAFRHGRPAMVGLEPSQTSTLTEASHPNALEFSPFLETEGARTELVAGSEFSAAAITGLAIDVMRPVRIKRPPDLVHVERGHADLSARQVPRSQ
jgi:glutathione S-transferase